MTKRAGPFSFRISMIAPRIIFSRDGTRVHSAGAFIDWHQPEGRGPVAALAQEIGYPLVVRPSYVLGGRAMEIVHGDKDLERYMREAVRVSEKSPVLLDRFLDDAIEVDVDCIADGTDGADGVMIGGIMEHVEEAGVHSGDSACAIPPQTLPSWVVEGGAGERGVELDGVEVRVRRDGNVYRMRFRNGDKASELEVIDTVAKRTTGTSVLNTLPGASDLLLEDYALIGNMIIKLAADHLPDGGDVAVLSASAMVRPPRRLSSAMARAPSLTIR